MSGEGWKFPIYSLQISYGPMTRSFYRISRFSARVHLKLRHISHTLLWDNDSWDWQCIRSFRVLDSSTAFLKALRSQRMKIIPTARESSHATKMQSAWDRILPNGAACAHAPLHEGWRGRMASGMHAACLLAWIDCIYISAVETLRDSSGTRLL